MNNKKKLDLLLTFVIFVGWSIVSLVFRFGPLLGGGLSVLLPSIYLMRRENKNNKKIFWAVLLLGGLWGFVFDFIATLNGAWFVSNLLFPWRVFGVLPVDDIIGFLLMTLFMVVFYEHFIDDEKNKKISKNLIFSLIPPILAGFAVMLFIFLNRSGKIISFMYFYGGLAMVLPLVVITLYKPKLFRKFLYMSAAFFFIWFVAEVVALKTGGWFFFGQYVGMVSVFGVRFPFEELFFWMMLYASTTTAYYELFIDDMK